MTIDRTYPIFTVRWLAVHGLASGHWILTNVFVTQADILASASSTPAFAFASL